MGKRVLVVGGVAGGASVAARVRRLMQMRALPYLRKESMYPSPTVPFPTI